MRSALEERTVLRSLAGWMAEDLDAAVIVATVERDLGSHDAQVHLGMLDASPEHLIVAAAQLLERARDRFLAAMDTDRSRALVGVQIVENMLAPYHMGEAAAEA